MGQARKKLLFYLDFTLLSQLLLSVGLLLVLLVAPLASVAYVAVQYNPLLLFSDPTYFSSKPQGELLFTVKTHFRGREVTIARRVGASSGVIAHSLIVFPGRNALRILATVPLLQTPFINSFVIKKLFDWRDGLISWLLCDIIGFPVRVGLEGLAAVAAAQIMTFFPIVYLNVYASMVGIDPSLEEQAENLGARGFKLFRTVTLPLSLPGLAAGAALVVLHRAAHGDGHPLGLAAVYLGLLPLLLFLAFPQIAVFAYAFAERWTGPLPEGFTLEHLRSIVADPLVSRAVYNSLIDSAAALALIVLLGVSAPYVIARARLKGLELLDLLVTSPVAIPGLAVAVGYFYFFSTFFRGTPLDPISAGPSLLLILAYSVRRLPFTARAVFAGLQQVHVALEEASMNLGAGRLRTLMSVVLPLIGLSVLSGALVSFVYCVGETSTSVTLGGLGGVGEGHKAPITFIMMDYLSRIGGPHIVAALGVLLITLQLTAIVVVNVVLKQRYAYIGV